MLRTFILAAVLPFGHALFAQDTFSILAFDSITREVGAAGASCVDLTAFPFSSYSADFISELFPGEGGINTQANYLPSNQIAARNRFQAGDSPAQIISYLLANDAQSNPGGRQYGVIRINKGYPQAAAFTGSNCLNYKNHITGPNYSIQGNILLGQQVLDSMEARFKREPGDLACKLMAAMQGAKRIGADSRCAPDGSSSLFAFLKVAQLTDVFGQPSFLVSVKTASMSGIEPIDSLQVLFNAKKSCTLSSVGIYEKFSAAENNLIVYPNPAGSVLNVTCGSQRGVLLIRNMLGQILYEKEILGQSTINTSGWQKGIYLVEFGGKCKKVSITDR